MDTWGQATASPLGNTDWTNYFTDKVPETGWWNQVASPFQYDQGTKIQDSFDYDPGGGGGMYGPLSGLTNQIIDADIDDWMRNEYPELYQFGGGDWMQGGVAGAGTVAAATWLGQFHRSPGVDQEIQAAATKYGVPANFLKAIIAKESSGDWSGGNTTPQWVASHSPDLGLIHGYVGVFERAATSRGLGDLWQAGRGNRGAQIELLAAILKSQYDQVQKQNPQYGWTNVAALHYSGDPSGQTNPAGWQTHGTTQKYMQTVGDWWKRMDSEAGNTWSNFSSTGSPGGISSPNVQAWGPINQYDSMIAAASQKYGVPANLIKAVMRVENPGGDPRIGSPQGATGLMQIMPSHVGGNQSLLYDPETNIDVGTRILMDNFRRWGSWEGAAKAYLAGFPTSTAVDAHGTGVQTYWASVSKYWDELNGHGSGIFGSNGQPVTTTQMNAIWGGTAPNITQGFGRTSFSEGHIHPGGMYDYATRYGVVGHPALDIGMPVGTKLYSPGSGTVIRIDNGAFTDYSGSGPNRGELRIRLDNGHEVILGHMNSITVPVGTRVVAGTPVGLSGKYETDRIGHLHLEYRIPDMGLASGWRAVNPSQYLGGTFTGALGGSFAGPTGLGFTQPMTFQNLMKAGASGAAIPSGPVYSGMGGGNSSWNAWMRQAMQGSIPTRIRPGQSSYLYTYNPGGGLPSSLG